MHKSIESGFSNETNQLIKQLPEEIQLKIFSEPHLQQSFDDLVMNPKSLRENLTELIVQHQRKNRLEWENDDYSDFFGLLMILDQV
jgi:hypothetical protein